MITTATLKRSIPDWVTNDTTKLKVFCLAQKVIQSQIQFYEANGGEDLRFAGQSILFAAMILGCKNPGVCKTAQDVQEQTWQAFCKGNYWKRISKKKLQLPAEDGSAMECWQRIFTPKYDAIANAFPLVVVSNSADDKVLMYRMDFA